MELALGVYFQVCHTHSRYLFENEMGTSRIPEKEEGYQTWNTSPAWESTQCFWKDFKDVKIQVCIALLGMKALSEVL